MKNLLLYSFIIAYVVISSCTKEGCRDIAALNYSVEAQKDDGSCKYPNKIRIRSVEMQVFQSEYFTDWTPDCQVSIQGLDLNYTSEQVSGVQPNEIVYFNIEPNLIIPIGENGGSFACYASAIQGSYVYNANLPDFHFNGFKNNTYTTSPLFGGYPYSVAFYNRIELVDQNEEGLIRITLLVDWE